MKALVLTALRADDEHGPRAESLLLDVLADHGYAVETVACLEADVIPCTGCGSCGMRTPGACVVKDDMQGVFRALVASDLLVLATPVRFGSYCAQLKKVVDRFQPLMVPLYTVRDDEMHFRARYDLPALLGVGLVREGEGEDGVGTRAAGPDGSDAAGPDGSGAAEADAFRFLIGRLATNIETRHSAAAFAGGDGAAARTELERALAKLEAADVVGVAS
jgi:multimeric flavodoxin WrbA